MLNLVGVVIADDHALVREGLKTILKSQPGINVLGMAENGEEAVRLCKRLNPDIVLMDLSMPVKSGVQAIQELAGIGKTKILALTAHDESTHIFSALDAGASGYVLKTSSSEELMMAIRTVIEGKVYLAPDISGEVARGFLRKERNRGCDKLDTLTNREREILKHVLDGYKNREIADLLIISVKTVEKHRSNMMKKLGLRSISEVRAYGEELKEKGIFL
ncbi:response regulator [Maridesulfovibrio hydrothermalis]|uniref:Oxygen regulatory protein nreC n=1 Tax=Maridesulfovibrio hydrothermalis AM13 = DSM 14728 TaxID=1121451 RepID=L0RCR3_9BACT|nr:response regulator transcription factor [Maridesulfovibrio hydrothermalis]CCO24002.1 Oxygen regulatory protein nreC [Maridesulfovibrio hydrothermalis AM13 = DSM 14728]